MFKLIKILLAFVLTPSILIIGGLVGYYEWKWVSFKKDFANFELTQQNTIKNTKSGTMEFTLESTTNHIVMYHETVTIVSGATTTINKYQVSEHYGFLTTFNSSDIKKIELKV